MSLLTSLGVACLGAALLVALRWARRRPAAFPAWSCMGLVVLALLCAIPGAQRRIQEHRLESVARRLVGHSVSVHCQSTAAALVDAGAELGYVPFDADGVPLPTTVLKREPCRDLRAYVGSDKSAPTLQQVVAVHVLTHEAMHLRGQTSEATAECEAVQRDAVTAHMLGASLAQAAALAQAYWTEVYPRMPDDYRTGACTAGGPLDEGLATAPWAGR